MFGQPSVIEMFRKLPDYIHQTLGFFLAPVTKKLEELVYIAWFQWFIFSKYVHPSSEMSKNIRVQNKN